MINHIGSKTIITDRLILRKYQLSDANDMFHNWCSNPNVCKYYTWTAHRDINETKSLISMWIKQYDDPLVFHWIIIDKSTKQAIGSIYLDELNDVESSAVISCLFSQLYWGKGFATEATKAVIQYAFEKVGLERINSHHHEQNVGSEKALTKSGLRFIERRFVSFPECSRIDGNYLFYSISKNDWICTK